MDYLLYLTVLFGDDGFSRAVPGFESKVECEMKGSEIRKDIIESEPGIMIEVKFACIKQSS
jgi:hypothetical protein